MGMLLAPLGKSAAAARPTRLQILTCGTPTGQARVLYKNGMGYFGMRPRSRQSGTGHRLHHRAIERRPEVVDGGRPWRRSNLEFVTTRLPLDERLKALRLLARQSAAPNFCLPCAALASKCAANGNATGRLLSVEKKNESTATRTESRNSPGVDGGEMRNSTWVMLGPLGRTDLSDEVGNI